MSSPLAHPPLIPLPRHRPTMKQQNVAAVATRNWRGESPEERRVQRRERLVEACIEVFGRLGAEKATIRDICAQARLTERYFYESFRSTEDAFDTVYAQLRQDLVDKVTTALAQAPMTIPDLASAGLRAFYTYIKEDRRRAQIILIDAFYANRKSANRSRTAIKEYVQMVDRLAKALYPELPPEFDVEMLAWGLVGMAIQVGTIWAISGFKKPIDAILSHNLYAWRGLQKWVEAYNRSQSMVPASAADPSPGKAPGKTARKTISKTAGRTRAA